MSGGGGTFLHGGTLFTPTAARLIFVTVAALGAEGCVLKIEGSAPTMIGQWIVIVFRCGHPAATQ